jgi:hypothetical protein
MSSLTSIKAMYVPLLLCTKGSLEGRLKDLHMKRHDWVSGGNMVRHALCRLVELLFVYSW